MQRYHGRTAAAPVFPIVDGGNDSSRGFGEPLTIGRLAAFLSAFHLSQAGVPAASMTSAKMVDDHLPSIVNVFFVPSSRSFSAPNNGEGVQETYQTPSTSSTAKCPPWPLELC